MAINPLLQGLVNTAKTSATVVKKNTETKAKNALGLLVTTQKETMPQARANALLPGLLKVAETTGKVGQQNVVNQQAKAKELLGGLTSTAINIAGQVKQQSFEKQTNAIGELGATVLENPNVEPSKLKQAFPEFANLPDNILGELGATVLENPNVTTEQLRQAFPELDQSNKPQEKSSGVSNVIGGAYRSVVDLPQSISESGILDAPAEYLAKGPVGEAIRSGAKLLFGEQAVKQYQQKEGNKPFSEVAKGMVVGDPNSKLYQGTRVAGDVIQTGIGITQAAKSIAKNTAKKNVLNIIKEADTIGNKRAALSRGGLETQSKISKFLRGSKDLVKPSQRTLDAVDEVVKVIKSPSKDPQKLFTQVSTKISDIGSSLGSKLKTIGIKGTNLSTSNLKTKLTDLSTEIKDISPAMGKRLQTLSKNITNSETADDFRKSLQQLDDMVPDSIKSGVDLSGKDQYIYDAWRAARSEGNDVLAKIAETIPDTEVKKAFKSMSNLYQAKGQISSNIGRLTPKVTGLGKKLSTAAKGIAGTAIGLKVGKELGIFD